MSNQTINNLNVSNSINTTNLNCDNINCDNITTDNVNIQNINVQKINNNVTSQNLSSLDTTTSLVLQLANLKTYIDSQIQTLFNNPDINLNSVVELANALNNDRSYATNISNSLANKISLTSDNQTITANNMIFNNPIVTPNILIKNNDNTLTSLNSQIATRYTKTETDDLLKPKANQTTTYTKVETDDLLSSKANYFQINDKITTVDNRVTGNLNSINTINEYKANKLDVSNSLALKVNTIDLLPYYSKTDSDNRFLLNSASLQTIPYLSAPKLLNSVIEGTNFIKNYAASGYYKVLNFNSQSSIDGHKISIEIKTAWGFSLTNSVFNDTCYIDAMICNNDTTSKANIISTHYFMGNTNIDCITDIVFVQATNNSTFSARTSYDLYIKFGIYSHSQVFVKHSTGSTVIIYNTLFLSTDVVDYDANYLTVGLQAPWVRSVNKYSNRSPSQFYNTVTLDNKDNLMRFSGQIAVWLLNGGNNIYEQHPICWSQQQFYAFNAHDGIVINPMYGCILYENSQYFGTTVTHDNFNGSSPLFIGFASDKRNVYEGIKIFFKSFSTEITVTTLSS